MEYKVQVRRTEVYEFTFGEWDNLYDMADVARKGVDSMERSYPNDEEITITIKEEE
jgi:hypothetical protein